MRVRVTRQVFWEEVGPELALEGFTEGAGEERGMPGRGAVRAQVEKSEQWRRKKEEAPAFLFSLLPCLLAGALLSRDGACSGTELSCISGCLWLREGAGWVQPRKVLPLCVRLSQGSRGRSMGPFVCM